MEQTSAPGAAGGGFSGCAQTLTGPIERGDIMTVKKHLDHLERPEWKAVYRAVGLQVTEAAVKTIPDSLSSAMAR